MLQRPYQIEAIDQTIAAFTKSRAVLGVAATGMGKTVIGSMIAERLSRAAPLGRDRVMWLAHREELLFQAGNTIEAISGEIPELEMAEARANEFSLRGQARYICGSVQTLSTGGGGKRLKRFKPDQFCCLVVDEAHHATAASYRRVIQHMRSNPDLLVLGLTATPNRADEIALSHVFDSVAFNFDIRYGIDEGWLVPIHCFPVEVEELDYSGISTSAGELNGAELAQVLEFERNLIGMAAPTIEIACDMPQGTIQSLIRDGRLNDLPKFAQARRLALFFAVRVEHAERMEEILNRFWPGIAKSISGKTPKEERRKILGQFKRREFQILVNVGVATEGFDNRDVEVVVVGRPTLSTPLFVQMCGRATRPAEGVVEDHDVWGSAELRKDAIAASRKPRCILVDFVGNAGRHKLVSAVDVLAGRELDEETEILTKEILRNRPGKDVMQAIAEASAKVAERQREREERRRKEAESRKHLVATAEYRKDVADPFAVFNMQPWRQKPGASDEPATEKMISFLSKQGIDAKYMSRREAAQLIFTIRERWDSGLCSFGQARILAKRGLPVNVTYQEARKTIDEIALKEGWADKKGRRMKPVVVAPAGVRF